MLSIFTKSNLVWHKVKVVEYQENRLAYETALLAR